MQRSQLRTATQTRRSARTGFPEPDDFEGLPVRQWRQEWVTVAPSSQQEMTQQGDRWAVELPYGMPRESHLLPPHTQELLRAARSGRLYKRPAPADEEDQDAEIDIIKGEKKDWEPQSDGYMVKMWKQVPRNAESHTTSHLAKRHKNTVTLASRAVAPQLTGPTVIRATVRRIDAAGNPYEQTVTLSEGQQVDGEIISTTVVPAPAAVQGELPVQQAAPVRRRPPPPKRKAKGAGRGRKKGKLPLPVPATRSQGTAAEGTPSIKPENVGADGIKIEDTEDGTNQDSEMADMSGIPSDDDEGEGGEGEEDDEGEDDAGDDESGETPNAETASADAAGQESEDAEMSEAIQPSSVEEPDEPRPASEEAEEVTIPKARFQPPSLTNLGPPLAATHLGSRIEGSPLKNVMILSPTDPSPMVSPHAANTSFSASSYMDVQSRTVSMDMTAGSTVSQAYATETTAHGIPPPLRAHRGPGHTAQQTTAPASSATETTSNPPDEPNPPAAPEPATSAPNDASSHPPAAASTEQTAEPTPGQTPEVSLLQPPDSPALLPTVTEDEDEGLNLLGSLERELDRQEGVSNASGSGNASRSGSDAAEGGKESVDKTETTAGAETAATTSAEANAEAAAPETRDNNASAPAAGPADSS